MEEGFLRRYVWTGGAMEIKVLGRGCHECDETLRNVERAVHNLGLEAVVVRISSVEEMGRYDYPRPPGLVIDGSLICSGRTMGIREIKHWLLRGRDAACAA
jgi:hypothetical protein